MGRRVSAAEQIKFACLERAHERKKTTHTKLRTRINDIGIGIGILGNWESVTRESAVPTRCALRIFHLQCSFWLFFFFSAFQQPSSPSMR